MPDHPRALQYSIIFRNLIDLTVDESQPWQLQPQFTSVAPQFTTVSSVYDPSAVQAQFTAFDPYAQQAQYEAMLQADYARQQAEAVQQQQYYALQMQAAQYQATQFQPLVPQKTAAVHGCVTLPLYPMQKKHRSIDVTWHIAQTTPLPKRLLPQFPPQDPRTPIPRRLRAHLQHPPSCMATHVHTQVPRFPHTRPRFPRVPPSHLVRRRWPPFLARVPGRAASTRSETSGRSAMGVPRLVTLRGSALVPLLLCFHKNILYFVCPRSPLTILSLCIMSKTHSSFLFYCKYYVLGCSYCRRCCRRVVFITVIVTLQLFIEALTYAPPPSMAIQGSHVPSCRTSAVNVPRRI